METKNVRDAALIDKRDLLVAISKGLYRLYRENKIVSVKGKYSLEEYFKVSLLIWKFKK